MRVARGILVGVGVALIVAGAVFEVTLEPPTQVPGVLLWLAAAVVLHDAVLSPVVLVADRLSRRAGRRLPPLALVAAQVAVVAGVVLTFVALPALLAKPRRPANPTVLPLDYGLGLAIVWAVLVVAALVVGVVATRRARRADRAAAA